METAVLLLLLFWLAGWLAAVTFIGAIQMRFTLGH
jgi:hypothetical protein